MTQLRLWNFLFVIFVAMAGVLPVCAQQYPPSQFKPIVPAPIDPEALKMPKPALPADTAQPAPEADKDAAAKLKAPSIDLGKYDLKFDAGKTSDVNPRTGFDSGETSNLSKVTPGKTEGVTPDYFGLKLSVPTHK